MLHGMTELVFLVEEDPEGGFVAKAVGQSVSVELIASKHYKRWCVARSAVISRTSPKRRS
jgi:hypothetical protein